MRASPAHLALAMGRTSDANNLQCCVCQFARARDEPCRFGLVQGHARVQGHQDRKELLCGPSVSSLHAESLHADLLILGMADADGEVRSLPRCLPFSHLKRALTLRSSRSYRTPTRCSWTCDSLLRLLVMTLCTIERSRRDVSVGKAKAVGASTAKLHSHW